MDPSLQSTIVEEHIPLLAYYVAAATLVAFISMFVSCYSITWKGILAGWILLLISMGGFAYIALNFIALSIPPTNTEALQNNKQEVVEWVQTDYGLTITPSEASDLLGNAGEVKLAGNLQFGSITVPNTQENAATEERNITMAYVDGDWRVVEFNEKDTYREVEKTNE